MDTLKLAGDPSRGSVTGQRERHADHDFFGDRQLEPDRAARRDTDPTTRSSAVADAGDPSGPGASETWRLGPIRATRDDMDAFAPVPGQPRSRATPAVGSPDSPAVLDLEIPARPARVGNQDADVADGHVRPSRHERPDAGESASTMIGTRDPRNLPRGPGAARIAGIALALIAFIGVAIGGGYFVWRTEFVPPALVGRLTANAVPIVDLTPVSAADAATNETGGPAASATLRTDTPARPETSQATTTMQEVVSTTRSDAQTRQEADGDVIAPSRASMDAPGGWPASTAETFVSDRPAAFRPARAGATTGPGHPEHLVVADDRPAAREAPMVSPRHEGWTAAGRRDRLPAAAPGSTASPVEAGTPMRADAFVDVVDLPIPDPDQGGAEHARGAESGIVLTSRIRPDHVAASLDRAYRAFVSGDASSATKAYRDVLRQEPGNRDAHLGLAALAMRAGRWNEVAGHYAQVLESNPADTVARAALIGIEEPDPVRGEDRLKALLRREPHAAHLHFELGNLYAARQRWPEAQRSWSDAYRFDGDNPDYAYNLAVGLDHLSRPQSALRRYREALFLSRSRAAGFETADVLQRIRDLDPHAKSGSTSDGPTGDAAVDAPGVRIR